jgi:hypothetical protein
VTKYHKRISEDGDQILVAACIFAASFPIENWNVCGSFPKQFSRFEIHADELQVKLVSAFEDFVLLLTRNQ